MALILRAAHRLGLNIGALDWLCVSYNMVAMDAEYAQAALS